MKKNKGMKLYSKLMIGFLLIDLIMIIMMVFGYSSMKTILTVDDPQRYFRNYNIYVVVMAVLLIIVMLFLSRTILAALRKGSASVIEATRQIAQGEVDVELHKEKNDEFGEIIDEYQQLIANTRYLADAAGQVADGDLTIQVVPRCSGDALGNSLKQLVERNRDSLLHINDAAIQVQTSSAQVASASESLAQGSTEQASAIEQITASIGEIAEKTKTNASEANEVAEIMTNALEDVKKGNVQMEDMVVAMEEINKASESISRIIKVIDDIAFQTNILALNAAVEAARAGEAGKGFAVVAEEVRSLAAKSASAAAETAELIEDSMCKVEIGSKLASETSKALEEITTGVSKSGTMIVGIAESSNYQATAVAQINQAIGQVSQVVQTNSATSEQCAAAAEELSNQSRRMREMMAVYKLGATPVNDFGTSAYGADTSRSYGNDKTSSNEQIISLGDDFGKY